IGSLSMVATAMPQQASSMAVSGPPAITPVVGLPTSSSRQSSCMLASPRATATTFRPNALLCGMVSEKSCWKKATRSCGVVSGDLAIVVPVFLPNEVGEVSASYADGGVMGCSLLTMTPPPAARAPPHRGLRDGEE